MTSAASAADRRTGAQMFGDDADPATAQSSRYNYAPVARKRTLAQPVVLGSLIPGLRDWRGKEYYCRYL
jgi:hypothetical protein